MKFQWEELYDGNLQDVFPSAARAKVIGGWIVSINYQGIFHLDKGQHFSTLPLSTVFVPDANHKWKII